jgi:hypothetical protein
MYLFISFDNKVFSTKKKLRKLRASYAKEIILMIVNKYKVVLNF